MEDFERYGDYNDLDDAPKSKNTVLIIIKVLITLVILFVVGILAFRIILFNYYPKNIKEIYFNDTLTEYYNSTDGEIGALTQELRAPYDDAKLGNFMADNLIVIKGADQLQISIRCNRSVLKQIQTDYGVDVELGEDAFSFELYRDPRVDSEDGEELVPEKIGHLTYCEYDSMSMYSYYKLVFDGVDFEDGSDEAVEWIRVEITINGVEMEKPYMIPIYENHSGYSKLDDYKLSGGEQP